ncbi:MAG: hypothetical protein GY828_03235 [Candidatus Gracilibacteria bacterium]|nr:hypothetical protein [Candidatus Gracilibacteria bacterium]
MFKKTILGVVISGFALSAQAGYSKENNVNHFTQEKNYYCQAAVIQMYNTWIRENSWFDLHTHTQDEIAEHIGARDSNWGFGVRDMAEALEDFTPFYGYYFSPYNTSSKDTFVKKIIAENEGDDPVVVVTRTRRTDNTYRAVGHYTIIDGFEQNSSQYQKSVSSTTGFYVKDPMWDSNTSKSAFSDYKAIDPRTAFPQQEFMSDVVGMSKNRYYLVYR